MNGGKAVSKPSNRPLLILDLDETLIRGATQALDRAPDMMLAHYFVYFRPHVREFLAQCNEKFTLSALVILPRSLTLLLLLELSGKACLTHCIRLGQKLLHCSLRFS
jgi:hypothetical protein